MSRQTGMISKQHILDEIKRTAEANNGVAPGMGHFLRETGIKRSDWEGKFWPRWNDAVRDAGFAPNSPQEAYSDEFLIEKLIALIRELGHFPLRAEQAIKSRNDSQFPSPQTLQKRFGTRHQIAAPWLPTSSFKRIDDDPGANQEQCLLLVCRECANSSERTISEAH